MAKLYKNLVWIATLLTLVVVVLGAYVRLSDAGLGCPDWPGCYGYLSAPRTAEQIANAQVLYPGQPIEKPKAAKEMLHRYVAGTLGLLILGITVLAFTVPRGPTIHRNANVGLLVLVIFQALLGMWTVTLLLKPVIVTAHLLGGMATWALLVWLSAALIKLPRVSSLDMKRWSTAGLVVLVLQIALGGWVSSNYAALACTDFPLCQGSWLPPMDFSSAFHFTRELGKTSDGGLLSLEALTAVHWTHRLGAFLTFIILLIMSLRAMRAPALRAMAYVILVLLVLQISLGIANVWLSLPLLNALGHNAVAALLLGAVVMLKSSIAKPIYIS